MNRTIRTALTGFVAWLSLGLVGCTDPSVSPSSTVSEDIIFKKDQGAYLAFLAKIYGGLSNTGQQGPAGNGDIQSIDEGFSQYVRLYWEHQELPTDEATIAWGGDGSLTELNTAVWGSTNTFVSAMFSRIYYQVVLVNDFLRQTSPAKLDENGAGAAVRAKIPQYRAEARFLRALSLWHGLDLFGPIPLVTSNSPTPPQQNTQQEVYDFLVSELTDIQTGSEQLPSAGPGTYGRATKEAASMLLAHIYLNAEVYTHTPHYDLALGAAQAVINGPFSLNPVYRNNFTADNNLSPEIIFPVVQDGIHSKSYGGTTFLIHASCGDNMNPATYGVDGCWYGLRLREQAYNLSAGDPRATYFDTTGRSATITSLTASGQGIAAPKYTNIKSTGGVGSNTAFPDTDFPMFRLADAYLIYAEAVLRGGGGTRQQALDYVNALRVRAYGDASGNITDAELTLPFLLDERSRELLWEGHRRSDLIRYGLFTGGDYLWAWKGNVLDGAATQSFLNLYPIPASQLSANPFLKQNPGY